MAPRRLRYSASMVPVWMQPPLMMVVPSSRPLKATRPSITMTWLETATPSASSLMELEVSPLLTSRVMLRAYCSMEEIFPSASSMRLVSWSAVIRSS